MCPPKTRGGELRIKFRPSTIHSLRRGCERHFNPCSALQERGKLINTITTSQRIDGNVIAYLDKHSDSGSRPYGFLCFASFAIFPRGWWDRPKRCIVLLQLECIKRLQDSDHHYIENITGVRIQHRDTESNRVVENLLKLASLYAKFWPKQIRGPALKGRNLNGSAVTSANRSGSIHRSGSNSSASSPHKSGLRCITIGEYPTCTPPAGTRTGFDPGAAGNRTGLLLDKRAFVGTGGKSRRVSLRTARTGLYEW